MALFENRDNSTTMASASVHSVVNSVHQSIDIMDFASIEIVLALTDSRLQRKICDEVMLEAWSMLWNATG